MTEANLSTTPDAWLYVQRGPLADTIIPLQPGANVFGREEGYVLPDERVSRRHARILAVSGEYILIDLGSSNGTFLNGQRVTGPVMLQHGDVIQLGGTLMVFHIRGMQGNEVDGTGAATPAAKPAQLSDSTIVITRKQKQA